MSTAEKSLLIQAASSPRPKASEGVLAFVIRQASSVRLGVVLLCLLGLACVVGMLIMQQNVDGFENYYAQLTPSQRLLYSKLGFFNIYHVWYFNVLLAMLSLNIVLASIERFPKTWTMVSRPQVTVPVRWLLSQKRSESFETGLSHGEVQTIAEQTLRRFGWKRLRTKASGGRTFVMAESGVWNRFGAYPVHVALLTIFFGGFLTAQLGTTGNLPLAPGESSDIIRETVVDLDRISEVTKQLPFEVTFTDIEQELIRKEGSLTPANTLDWITRFTIRDGDEVIPGIARMNQPFDYRGYRFFQASFISIGRARAIDVTATPATGGQPLSLSIERNGSTTLPDGTLVRFSEFRGNFRIGPEDPNEDTTNYPNPAAVLTVVPPGGTLETAYAFGPQMANIPIAGKPVAGYTFRLNDFEKVADRHILSVQRDPGSDVVYVGFLLLFLTLVSVFFFSHQRVWVAIEDRDGGGSAIVVGGNANRNQAAFGDKVGQFAEALRGQAAKKEIV